MAYHPPNSKQRDGIVSGAEELVPVAVMVAVTEAVVVVVPVTLAVQDAVVVKVLGMVGVTVEEAGEGGIVSESGSLAASDQVGVRVSELLPGGEAGVEVVA